MAAEPIQQIVLRLATIADADSIATCTEAAYAKYIQRLGRKPQPMTADYASMIAEDQIWIAEMEGTCVGTLVLKAEASYLLIYSVAVQPAIQKLGLGKRLMALAETEAKRQGYSQIRLYTNQLMAENILYYEALGYNVTSKEDFLGSTRVNMAKTVH